MRIIPAVVVHGGIIAASALQFGRVPLIGTRDTLSFLAWSLGAALLAFGWRRARGLLTVLAVALILLLLAGSAVSPVMRAIASKTPVVMPARAAR